MSQTFDTKKLFKRELTKDQKINFGELVKDTIVSRTLAGFNNQGSEKFVKYSKKYAKDKGVSRTAVDLNLSFNMLGNQEVEVSGDDVVISIDSADAAKAHGHQNGSKILPQRSFFGLSVKSVGKIVSSLKKDFKEDDNASRAEANETFKRAVDDAESEILDILGGL